MKKKEKQFNSCRDYQEDWCVCDSSGETTGQCANCGDKRENHQYIMTGGDILREIFAWLFIIAGIIFLISFIK